jgi:tetratricopeptide (TPR) repeat protein
MKEIGRELDVEALIEGTLTRVDSMIDLRLKLIDISPEESTMWSQSYTTTFGQLPNLYREVTHTIAAQISGVITPNTAEERYYNSSVDPKAYRAYLKGSYYTGYLTAEGFQKGEEFFQQAIQLDSNFAAPYAGLASIWMAKKQKYLVEPDSASPVIRALLDRALERDKNSSTAWGGIGTYHFTTTYNWREAENAFKKALALNPNESMTRKNYAHLLMILNRWDEAWEQMDYVTNIDPDNPWTIAFSAVMYFHSRKTLSAIKKFDQLIALVPNNPMAVNASLMLHANTAQYDEAIEDLKKMLMHIGQDQLNSRLDSVYIRSDFKTAVRTITEALEIERRSTFIAPSFMIRLYGPLLNDKEKFLDCVEQMYTQNDPDLGYFGIKRPDGPFQTEPRYIAVMEKIGLW